MKKENILVTGGAGFIGSHLVDKLIEENYNVVVIDNLSTGQEKNINKNAEFIQLDLSNRITTKNLKKIFKEKNILYVFHLAAVPRTQYCVENPGICHDSNVTGTLNLLEAISQSNVKKLVHSSSCSVYGIQNIIPISENATINLTNAYAVQKYMQEQYIRLYTTEYYSVKSVLLRYFNVYGTQRQSKEGSYPNVLSAFSKQKEQLGNLLITDDGEQTRDFVHVYDVANANILAMQSNFENAEVFNIGSGVQTSINQISKFFDCPVKYIDKRPGEAKHLFGNIKLAKEKLGWSPTISLEEGFKIYFNNQ